MTTRELRMMLSCHHCGGLIRGEVKITRPNYQVDPTDFARSYHPECYVKAEAKAAEELRKPTAG